LYDKHVTIFIETPTDFDFLECVNAHGWRQLAPFQWDAESNTLERVEEFVSGEIAVLPIRGRLNAVEVSVAGSAPESEIVRRVRHMLQLDLPMVEFHAYCAERPEISHVPSLRQGRLLRSPTLFEDVLKVIATTNTTWTQTKGMTARIVEHFGAPLGGEPDRKAFPSPGRIAHVSVDEFASKARMGYRDAAVHRIATEIAEGRLDLESWQDAGIPSADLFKRLLSLPGVGPYAASCLMIYLGRYDRVNVDSWARMMVGKELGRSVTDKEVHAFFEPYGEWKALVYHFYKWKEAEPEY
jgi:3-methyladenine DNA glycosylase/8-oxoguanine DNA glycosylase